MFRTLTFLLLAVAAVGLLAAPAVPGLTNFKDGDLIWDAIGNNNGLLLKAKYKESPDNGLLDQSLELEVQKFPPGSRLVVDVNGRRIGSMVADGFGHAVLRLDRFGIVPGPDGRPPAGKRIETGDVITVTAPLTGLTVSGSFQPRP